ncbi:MAG: hypothetical protein HN360_04075 [Rhodospirillaceae bacterium]|mgnify:CR=1 FL=1|jgi:dienelactone hydrolase|nr:hypothetical protein [Rhodospirillaceae bacterium]MBT4219369.1 hypothetical protein [Rhodospirillaceae bacterium]MBT4463822.1 hypothetical protein [Rhodospirillaceae bacterium]MBT7355275.1 hypothetical protein [Rhodospirillaceae bacterium]
MHSYMRPIVISIISILTVTPFSGDALAKAKKSLTAKDDGRIEFPMQATLKGNKIDGIGTLKFPSKDKGKFPVVILAHGTKGIGYREDSWAGFLQDQGYATFVLDYFKPRGTKGKGKNVPRPPEDVWGAISILSTHPRLDMNKVAVMGFSNGGSVTRSSANLNPDKDTNGVLPKAFIMVYGGCHAELKAQAGYNPALLYIAGGEDKLVKASTCLKRKNDARAKDIEVFVIDGAYHLFDGDKSATFKHPKWGKIKVKADKEATGKARQKVISLLERVF